MRNPDGWFISSTVSCLPVLYHPFKSTLFPLAKSSVRSETACFAHQPTTISKMVHITIVNSVTLEQKSIHSNTSSALLDVVTKSRHFGNGTLEDGDCLVSDDHVLREGAKLIWVPAGDGSTRRNS